MKTRKIDQPVVAKQTDTTIKEQQKKVSGEQHLPPTGTKKVIGDGTAAVMHNQREQRLRPTVPGRVPNLRALDPVRLEASMKDPIQPVYAGIEERSNGFHVQVGEGKAVELVPKGSDPGESLLSYLREYSQKKKVKIIAAGVKGESMTLELRSRLWFEADIVPLPIAHEEKSGGAGAVALATGVMQRFDPEHNIVVGVGEDHEVLVGELATLADYRQIVGETAFQKLQEEADKFKGKRLVFISSTPQGGGVALMRHALIRVYRLLGVDAHWHILEPWDGVFDITKKKIHNGMQDVGDPNAMLEDADVERLRSWSRHNMDLLEPVLKGADVVVIDDPQPAGLMPLMRERMPDKPIMYRSHTQLESDVIRQEGTRAHAAWHKWVWPNAQHADIFISHPVEAFVPDEVPKEKTVFMQPTTDETDGLNKQLSEWDAAYYLQGLNNILQESGQTPLDLNRPYIAQIARFDPSKGIPFVLEAYRDLHERLSEQGVDVPQLVIAGHGAVDDPEGLPILNQVMETLAKPEFVHLAGDVKVARLPHNDQYLNVLISGTWTGLQQSDKEGWEIKVTEGRRKGVPMVVSDAGGIPLQVEHEKSGFISPAGDTKRIADHLQQLCQDPDLHAKLKDGAAQVKPDGFTWNNAINWLFLANKMVSTDRNEGVDRSDIGQLILQSERG